MPEDEKPEDWRTICAMVSVEKDPARLLELVKKLNRALDEKFGVSLTRPSRSHQQESDRVLRASREEDAGYSLKQVSPWAMKSAHSSNRLGEAVFYPRF
jgi:hypothetical protein